MTQLQEEITRYIKSLINSINEDNKFLTLQYHTNYHDCEVHVNANLYGLLGLGQKLEKEYKDLLFKLDDLLINNHLDDYFTLKKLTKDSFSLGLNNNLSWNSTNTLITLIKLQKDI